MRPGRLRGLAGGLAGGPEVLAVLALVLLLLGSVLLLPRPAVRAEPGRPLTVLAVDASASVRRTRPDWFSWVRDVVRGEARAAAGRGDRLAVLAYAGDVRRQFGPGEPADFLARLDGAAGTEGPYDPRRGAGSDDATRLGGAVEAATVLIDEARSAEARLVLVGPGDWTGASPLTGIAALRRRGFGVTRIDPPPPELGDLALVDLRLPDPVETEAPLTAAVTLEVNRGRRPLGEARIAFRVEQAGGVTRRSFALALPAPVPLPAGEGTREPEVVHALFELGPVGFGLVEVEARVSLAAASDPVPENDVLARRTRTRGALVVGLVARPERREAAALWLTPSGTCALPGISIAHLVPAELPAAVGGLDAVVTFDVPGSALPAGTLTAFAREGGGWLAVSGWSFLEDWVPGREPEEPAALLPLRPAPLDLGPRDVLLLVDGSGSMAGEPFEAVRLAALDLVSAALPDDRVALRFFTTGMEPEIVIKARGDRASGEARRAAAQKLFTARVPGGFTSLFFTLEQLVQERTGVPYGTLAFFLTDGREGEESADPQGRAKRILDGLAAARTRLVPIAVGEHHDAAFLDLLVRDGEGWVLAEELDDLRGVFRRELIGARWRQGDALELVAGEAPPGSLAAEVGLPRDPLPPLRRFLRNELRPGAEALWLSDRGEPVLAIQRVGRGRTALLGTSPDPDWAPSLAGRPGLGEPAEMAGLLRFLARPTRELRAGRSEPRLSFDGRELVLEGLDSDSWDVPARVLDEVEGGLLVERLTFRPPLATPGPDPRRVRRARPSPELLGRLSRPGHALSIDVPGGAPRLLGIDPLPPPELTRDASRRLPGELLGPARVEEVAAPRSGEGPGQGHPAGPWVLAGGLAFLWAAVCLARAKQVPRSGVKGRGTPADTWERSSPPKTP